MWFQCKYCSKLISQARNRDGPNYCPKCHALFYVALPRPVPPWILGVLVMLTANWRLMCIS